MNALVLLLAATAVGVDYGWQPTTDGQLEYIVQIEPVTLVAMRSGQELVSQLDPYVRNVRRFRVRVGTDLVPRRGMPPTRAVPQKNLPVPDGVQYGWQPLDRDQSEFIIQVSHERLQKMRNGDEIVGEIPPDVLNVGQMRVRAGDGAVPRLGLQTASATMLAEDQPTATNQDAASRSIPASIIASPPKAGPSDGDTSNSQNNAGATAAPYGQPPSSYGQPPSSYGQPPSSVSSVSDGSVQPAPPLSTPPSGMPTFDQSPTLRIGDSAQPTGQQPTIAGQVAPIGDPQSGNSGTTFGGGLPNYSPQRADTNQQPAQNQYSDPNQNRHQSSNQYAAQNPTQNPSGGTSTGGNPGSTVSSDSASQRRSDGWNGQDFSSWPPPTSKAGPTMYPIGSTPPGSTPSAVNSATPTYNSQNQAGISQQNQGQPAGTASQWPVPRSSDWSTVDGHPPVTQQPVPPMVEAPPSQPVYAVGGGYGHNPGVASPAQDSGHVYGRSYPALPPLPGMDSDLPKLPWEERLAGRDSATKKSELSQEFWASLGGVTSDPSFGFLAGASSSDSGERPWGPLALTMMLLFISLGANLYIGWIAMDMYQRYLEMADDLSDDDSVPRRPASRERSYNDEEEVEDDEPWGGNYRRRRERSGVAA